MIDNLTIIDQIEVVTNRAIQVRIAGLRLVDGIQDGMKYVRATFSPESSIVDLLTHPAYKLGLARIVDAPIDSDHVTMSGDVQGKIHTQKVVRDFKASQKKFDSVVGPLPPDMLDELSVDMMRIAGADVKATKANGKSVQQVVPFTHQLVIPRSRELIIDVGWVELNGNRVTHTDSRRRRIIPGGSDGEFFDAAKELLEGLGIAPLPKANQGTVTDTLSVIHTTDVIDGYNEAYQDWRKQLLDAGRDPERKRPEFDPTTQLRIAHVGTRRKAGRVLVPIKILEEQARELREKEVERQRIQAERQAEQEKAEQELRDNILAMFGDDEAVADE